MSPTGDRVAFMWIDAEASDFQTNLAIYDASSGDVLVSITDEQLEGNVLWTSDDNPIIAASGNGSIEQESGGFGYLVQPSGRVVDLYTDGIQTSAGGGHYVSGFEAGAVVIDSSDGSTVGTIETSEGSARPKTEWSADDKVLVAHTANGFSVYRIG